MGLKEKLIEANEGLPARFEEQKDGSLLLESKIAERKVLLSKKTLLYRARIRIDDQKREVRFFEILKETGLGIAGSGELGGMSPGFGFKKETYKLKGKEREGSIQELSKLFGKDYTYSWDYAAVRKAVEREAQENGYSFSIVLSERSI